MMPVLSRNTQAILLLTAPLIASKGDKTSELLTHGEYNRLARALLDRGQTPGDLLGTKSVALADACAGAIVPERARRLLERGFLLSQSVEHWQARGIWVMSRADEGYPARLKSRLKEAAPPVLYGCGEVELLDAGGLAVVGSRQADADLLEYTEAIGRLAARARRAIVSGGARGIDQAAMRGVLDAGGKAIGFLAESLERAALARDHREFMMDERLVLVSSCDPSAGFNVGNAMQRNKAIYALADAALVVNSEFEKGGTWAGAAEQLKKFHFVPVYLRSTGELGKGMEGLGRLGARPWPNPNESQELADLLDAPFSDVEARPEQAELPFGAAPGQAAETPAPVERNRREKGSAKPEDAFAKARKTLEQMRRPKTEAEVAADLKISKKQAREWLRRLVEEGALEKGGRPIRYAVPARLQPTLFGGAE